MMMSTENIPISPFPLRETDWPRQMVKKNVTSHTIENSHVKNLVSKFTLTVESNSNKDVEFPQMTNNPKVQTKISNSLKPTSPLPPKSFRKSENSTRSISRERVQENLIIQPIIDGNDITPPITNFINHTFSTPSTTNCNKLKSNNYVSIQQSSTSLSSLKCTSSPKLKATSPKPPTPLPLLHGNEQPPKPPFPPSQPQLHTIHASW